MSAIVLDASALLALLKREKGYEVVAQHISGGLISTVNLIEVIDKLTVMGMTAEAAKAAFEYLQLEVRDFSRPLAETASALLPYTRAYGLSLADRACLSLAKMENAAALTADRVWKEVQKDIGVEVMLIR